MTVTVTEGVDGPIYTPAAQPGYHINWTAFEPYCDRDVTHIDTRGDCVFQCNTGYEDCDGNPSNGCEASISQNATCSTDCINCLTLSGIDRTTYVPNCVADPAMPGNYMCNFTCAGSGLNSCENLDGLWETGCEVATNVDYDLENVFMNQLENMDCSVMQAEAIKNPDMFRHHLHIDLTVPIPTGLQPPNQFLPAGTIFCNYNLALTTLYGGLAATNGKCFFMCIPGFVNLDGYSYNGCESPDTVSVPTRTYPYVYGGYWMGDYIIEEFFFFFCNTSSTNPLLFEGAVTVPSNVCVWNSRQSTGVVQNFDGTVPFSGIPIWY